MDERIKAIVLLRNCYLTQEQKLQLALKRAGTQPFQVVASLLKTLDRPETFLQQAASAATVKKSYPVAVESPAPPSTAGESMDSEMVRTMVREVVQEIVPWQEEADQDEEEYDSNGDFDSEGQ